MRYRIKPVRAESLHIEIASGSQIQRWAQKRLPNGSSIGEVTETETVRHKNLKPIMNGLFCERIFGPVKSYVCGCGKNQKSVLDKRRKFGPPRYKTYCPDCEVEITSSKKRRYRLGYIKLHSLVVHSWFYNLRHQNPLAMLLETENTTLLELFVYCLVEFVTLKLPATKESTLWYTKNQHRGHKVAYLALQSQPYCKESFSLQNRKKRLKPSSLKSIGLKNFFIKKFAQQRSNKIFLDATESSGKFLYNLSTNQNFFSTFPVYKIERVDPETKSFVSFFNYLSLDSNSFLTSFNHFFIWSSIIQKCTIRFIFIAFFNKNSQYKKTRLFPQAGQQVNQKVNRLIPISLVLQKVGFHLVLRQNIGLIFKTNQLKGCFYLQLERSREASFFSSVFIQKGTRRLTSIKFIVNSVTVTNFQKYYKQIFLFTNYWHKTFLNTRLSLMGTIAFIFFGGLFILNKFFTTFTTLVKINRKETKNLIIGNTYSFKLRIKSLKTKKKVFRNPKNQLSWSFFLGKQTYFVSLLSAFSIQSEPETMIWETKDRTFFKRATFKTWSAAFLPLLHSLNKKDSRLSYAQLVASKRVISPINFCVSSNFQNAFLPANQSSNISKRLNIALVKKGKNFLPFQNKNVFSQFNKKNTNKFLLVCQEQVTQPSFNSFVSRLEHSRYFTPYRCSDTSPSLVEKNFSGVILKTTNKIEFQHSLISGFIIKRYNLVYHQFQNLEQVVCKKRLSEHAWLIACIIFTTDLSFYKKKKSFDLSSTQLVDHSTVVRLFYSKIDRIFKKRSSSSLMFFETQLSRKDLFLNQKTPTEFSFKKLDKEKPVAAKLQQVFYLRKNISLESQFVPFYYTILAQKQLFQLCLLFFGKIVLVSSTFYFLYPFFNTQKTVADEEWLVLRRGLFLKKVKNQIFIGVEKKKTLPFVKTSIFSTPIKKVDNPVHRKKCEGAKNVVQRKIFFANKNVLKIVVSQKTLFWQCAILVFFSLINPWLNVYYIFLINILKNKWKQTIRDFQQPVLKSRSRNQIFIKNNSIIKFYLTKNSFLLSPIKSSSNLLPFGIKQFYYTNVFPLKSPVKSSFWLCLKSFFKQGQFYCYNFTFNKADQTTNFCNKFFVFKNQQQVIFLFALEPIIFFLDPKTLLANNFVRKESLLCKKQTPQKKETLLFHKTFYCQPQALSFVTSNWSRSVRQLKVSSKQRSFVFIDNHPFEITYSVKNNIFDFIGNSLIQSVINRKAHFLRLKFHSRPFKINSFIFDEYNKKLETTGPQAFLFLTSHHYTLKKNDRLRTLLLSARRAKSKLKKMIECFVNIPLKKKKERKKLKKKLKKAVLNYQYLKYQIKIFATSVNGRTHLSMGHLWPNMFLAAIPVLPPTLRPIITIQDQVAVSDVNHLYKRVLHRNNRFFRTLSFAFSQQVLQEAVDSLIGKKSKLTIDSSAGLSYNQQPLKSLSDILKGKKGRFRQNLLGKRVDYSGRSVIVVGPTLKLYECGLPREMALELFQPFLIKEILRLGKIKTIVEAKRFLKRREGPVWILLQYLLSKQPVFLNRAPTLHRLGIQAFQAKLVDGRALLLHPLVCAAFNADFDGDQMAVHIPLSTEACAESWGLMWSPFQLLSPANGQPSILPTQDMVLGCYYLTAATYQKLDTDLFLKGTKSSFLKFTEKENGTKVTNLFTTFHGAIHQYEQGVNSLHQNVWIFTNNLIESNPFSDEYVEEVRITSYGATVEFYFNLQCRFDCKGKNRIKAIRTTPGRALFNLSLNL